MKNKLHIFSVFSFSNLGIQNNLEPKPLDFKNIIWFTAVGAVYIWHQSHKSTHAQAITTTRPS